jgi:TetR/AcrR family transcriptional regulator
MQSRKQAVKNPLGRPVARFEGETRGLLLAAATQLFAEHGVAATTFTLIARRAGVTPAVVHYYFSDRDALIDAVVDERLVPLIASVWDPVDAQAAASVTLRGVVQRLLEAVEQNPWVPSTWMREILNEDGLLRSRVLRRLPLAKVRLLGEAMMRGQKDGTVHADLDPILIVFSTLGLVLLHSGTARFFAEIFHREVPNRKTLQRHIAGVLLHGVERQKKITSQKASSRR